MSLDDPTNQQGVTVTALRNRVPAKDMKRLKHEVVSLLPVTVFILVGDKSRSEIGNQALAEDVQCRAREMAALIKLSAHVQGACSAPLVTIVFGTGTGVPKAVPLFLWKYTENTRGSGDEAISATTMLMRKGTCCQTCTYCWAVC